MKKIILGALISGMSLSTAAQTHAQSNQTAIARKYTGHVSTDEQVRQMAAQLRLNEGQYIRFRDVSKARAGQIAEIKSLYPNDAAMQQAKINNVNKTFDAQLTQTLSPSQFTTYLQVVGQSPATQNANMQATGYGGRSFETGEAQRNKAQTGENNKDTSDNTSINNADNVKVKGNDIKVESEAGELKINKNGEKVKTKDMIYKADTDETKLKAKDGSFKAKSEEGKTKIETTDGKVKIEDGEVKIKPKRGKKVVIEE
ncbi:MAG: hypothetical protein COW65_08495 [Cytophagales bacterium CG18_big_fil_WC_8_21_14_2_50_42_9]|nr:MAG: hypothetical protein COW65_08495 [Cytophagales bacterium CG18_big_fil_WC_8_21_14_2_50_42_9]